MFVVGDDGDGGDGDGGGDRGQWRRGKENGRGVAEAKGMLRSVPVLD